MAANSCYSCFLGKERNQKQEASASGICPKNPTASSNPCGRLAEGAKQTVTWNGMLIHCAKKENLTACELGFLAENVYVLMPRKNSDDILVDLVVQISAWTYTLCSYQALKKERKKPTNQSKKPTTPKNQKKSCPHSSSFLTHSQFLSFLKPQIINRLNCGC